MDEKELNPRQVWTSCDQTRSSLDQIGQVWASFGPIWTSLYLYHNLPVIFFELLAAKVASKCG